ncbi:DNA-binding response regulator [Aureibaculum marinum]|uniref:DNA-binding response regulator n=1 Tax=Aureibaculum marinum TaxID=2487930 RepID=A0A3N4NI88_9FLAO|nr:response regulator [Aureibaculum marinum]RPD91219.1 DNA-binding response regulator [Aureibaculum marinum]
MKKVLKVLIIEDHKLIINAYKLILENADVDFKFQIDVATNCDEAFHKIKSCNEKPIDIIFLDIQLPASKDGQILSGENLGVKIKQLLPKSKIIINTSLNDNYRLYTILKNIKPMALMIKSEAGPNEITEAIKSVITDNFYYSNSILKLLNNNNYDNFVIDKIDRQLLYQLSLGCQIKELPNILPLEMAGIEKRKRHLKRIFNIKTNGNKELLRIARERGFI